MEPMATTAETITADLRARLAAREWLVEQQIPPLSELAVSYPGASAATLRRAQAPLIAQGWLRGVQGRGVYVAAIPPNEPTGADTAGAATRAVIAAIDVLVPALAELRRSLTELPGRQPTQD